MPLARGRNCALPQNVIAEDERRHRFNHRHCPRQHTRVVAAPRYERGFFLCRGDGSLPARNRGRWFEGDAKDDVRHY